MSLLQEAAGCSFEVAMHALVLTSGHVADAALLLSDGWESLTCRPWTAEEDALVLLHGDECGLSRSAEEFADRIAFLEEWFDEPPSWLRQRH